MIVNRLNAATIIECHQLAQLGSPAQCEYIDDDNVIVCEGEFATIDEWLRQNQFLWFLDMQEVIMTRVLADMIELGEHHDDEIGFYTHFYRRMLPKLKERLVNLA